MASPDQAPQLLHPLARLPNNNSRGSPATAAATMQPPMAVQSPQPQQQQLPPGPRLMSLGECVEDYLCGSTFVAGKAATTSARAPLSLLEFASVGVQLHAPLGETLPDSLDAVLPLFGTASTGFSVPRAEYLSALLCAQQWHRIVDLVPPVAVMTGASPSPHHLPDHTTTSAGGGAPSPRLAPAHFLALCRGRLLALLALGNTAAANAALSHVHTVLHQQLMLHRVRASPNASAAAAAAAEAGVAHWLILSADVLSASGNWRDAVTLLLACMRWAEAAVQGRLDSAAALHKEHAIPPRRLHCAPPSPALHKLLDALESAASLFAHKYVDDAHKHVGALDDAPAASSHAAAPASCVVSADAVSIFTVSAVRAAGLLHTNGWTGAALELFERARRGLAAAAVAADADNNRQHHINGSDDDVTLSFTRIRPSLPLSLCRALSHSDVLSMHRGALLWHYSMLLDSCLACATATAAASSSASASASSAAPGSGSGSAGSSSGPSATSSPLDATSPANAAQQQQREALPTVSEYSALSALLLDELGGLSTWRDDNNGGSVSSTTGSGTAAAAVSMTLQQQSSAESVFAAPAPVGSPPISAPSAAAAAPEHANGDDTGAAASAAVRSWCRVMMLLLVGNKQCLRRHYDAAVATYERAVGAALALHDEQSRLMRVARRLSSTPQADSFSGSGGFISASAVGSGYLSCPSVASDSAGSPSPVLPAPAELLELAVLACAVCCNRSTAIASASSGTSGGAPASSSSSILAGVRPGTIASVELLDALVRRDPGVFLRPHVVAILCTFYEMLGQAQQQAMQSAAAGGDASVGTGGSVMGMGTMGAARNKRILQGVATRYGLAHIASNLALLRLQ